MPLEIERKFLVDSTKWKPAGKGKSLVQAYLSTNPNPTVRVRIADRTAFLTIKGRISNVSRPEYEYEIPENEARELLLLAISEPVEKTRYEVFDEGNLWEVDVFSGKNSGLVMAEIEMESEDYEFRKPEWILEEVTHDNRYYNSYLSHHPYSEWGNEMV